MNLGTLNRARMLEHRIQHLTEMPKRCWNIVSNNTNMDICFSNNAANRNTQQYTSVLEDQTQVVQPINAAQPKISLDAALDALANKESILEPVIQLTSTLPSVSQIFVDSRISYEPDWTICESDD